ncbi:hypothetical protein LN019_26275, partial [Klebsiella pneumoniae]|nr:hypothetical protein [Klebsiella pneumoniae]MCJ3109009.1 hypothetical protein [Klebsiella pneumoniae]MCJ3125712.1 hypothetical protein [Klebsiella pneumoniae]MCJ3158705.1 hypothetical protein [Klebsiella pneumoniae]MCJ3169713.1 hypothetical protein [Klebsiella pneumoniae]
QTETEATGAPQKHHYTLNQQVGSITVVLYNLRRSIIAPKQQLFMFSIRDLIKVNCCFGIIFVRPLPILISGDGFLIKNDMLTTNQHCVISQES